MERSEIYKLIEDHYRAQYKALVNQVKAAVGGHHNAEDAVQEAFTRALRYWNTYNPDQEIGGWIRTILNNCVRDSQKESVLYGMVQEETSPLMAVDPASADDVFFARKVEEHIDSYPKHVALVLRSYFILGYTGMEIAQFTDYKPDAIRQIISRFRREYATA